MNRSTDLCALITLAIASLLAACAATANAGPLSRGAIISVESLQDFSRQSIDADNPYLELSGPAQCDVKVVQLTYESIGLKGERQILSAALYVPEHCPGRFPLLAQAHGTQAEKQHLTTEVWPAYPVITFFAARGYLVVATDYLGLGKSTFSFHPYLHADSEASAIIDSIRAAKTAARKLQIPINDQVMLFGYSQGGHAAMAAQREIERKYRTEINLVASAPMAGPYHLTQIFLGSWFGSTAGQENTLASELFAYTAVSYNRVYGTLYTQPQQLFAEPYAGKIEELFSGSLSILDIHEQKQLPPGHQLSALRNPRFTAEFLLDEKQPLRVALKKNELLDWAPTTPTLLCGSRQDAIVDFQSSYAAQAAFRMRGVEVPVVDVANEAPPTADGTAHHNEYQHLCFAKARAQLFDPLVRDAALAHENSTNRRASK